jgi:general secretion pathway protein M
MIGQLNPRERIFVIGGAIVLILVLFYFAIIAPYQGALRRFDQQIAARSGQLQDVKVLQARYLELKQQMSQVATSLDKNRDFSALTFIEELVGRTAGRENLISMRPLSPELRNEFTMDSVEIKLEKLTFKQVLELLAGIEGATTPVQVKNLYLKQRFDDRSLLDTTMTISALRRAT